VKKIDRSTGSRPGAGGRAAVSGLNWPLKFCAKVLLAYSNFVSLFYPMSKNKLSSGILVPISNRRYLFLRDVSHVIH